MLIAINYTVLIMDVETVLGLGLVTIGLARMISLVLRVTRFSR